MPKSQKQKRPASKKTSPLRYKAVSAWEKLTPAQTEAVMAHAEDYKRFLNRAKTERECVDYAVTELQRRGFKALEQTARLKAGDRVYKNIKGRALAAAVIGDTRQPWRLIGAHVDSPRLDAKPNPLLEEAALAMFQTHYYGGIKKYQWVNVPLSLHAVVHTRRGARRIVIGEAPGEPQFIIPDIPPHLAREQMDKKAKEAVEGEHLRVVFGHQPRAKTKETEKVKEAVLERLHREFGLEERDLFSADITFTPAAKSVDVGLDRALIAAYGQDDRACVYALLTALTAALKPRGTALGLFLDKEETGSEGDTGAQSRLLENFTAELLRKLGDARTAPEVLERAAALSADVTEGLNPNHKEISDARNSSLLGYGVSVEKYGGGGGKYGTNEASSEYMSWLVRLLADHHIPWQTGELGRVDLGGGGTIAMYFSKYGMDAIDVGAPLLSMHSTQELSSKVDLFFLKQCYEVFLNS
jgi:aspartyl aminopeptidase